MEFKNKQAEAKWDKWVRNHTKASEVQMRQYFLRFTAAIEELLEILERTGKDTRTLTPQVILEWSASSTVVGPLSKDQAREYREQVCRSLKGIWRHEPLVRALIGPEPPFYHH